MFEDILEDKKTRRNYYRDSYRRISKILYVSLITICIEIFFVMLILLTRATPDYYANNYDGDLTQIVPSPFGSRLQDPTPDLLSQTNKLAKGVK